MAGAPLENPIKHFSLEELLDEVALRVECCVFLADVRGKKVGEAACLVVRSGTNVQVSGLMMFAGHAASAMLAQQAKIWADCNGFQPEGPP